jgi:hypothetical protein
VRGIKRRSIHLIVVSGRNVVLATTAVMKRMGKQEFISHTVTRVGRKHARANNRSFNIKPDIQAIRDEKNNIAKSHERYSPSDDQDELLDKEAHHSTSKISRQCAT